MTDMTRLSNLVGVVKALLPIWLPVCKTMLSRGIIPTWPISDMKIVLLFPATWNIWDSNCDGDMIGVGKCPIWVDFQHHFQVFGGGYINYPLVN